MVSIIAREHLLRNPKYNLGDAIKWLNKMS
jgi:hypothetical protein